MNPSCKRFFLVVAMMTGVASSQVATGTPPFGSFGGGPFDTVNLGNLNVYFTIPVLNKSGRGTPFLFNLSYNSSIWTPVSSSGTAAWTPDSTWGWQSQTNAATGYLRLSSLTVTQATCTFGSIPHKASLATTTYSGFVDRLGTFHHVPGLQDVESFTATCGIQFSGASGTADDGSGYSVSISGSLGSGTIVTARNGGTVDIGAASGAPIVTGANGNEITTTISSGTTNYTDTLGQTVLTVSGGGTASSPITYSYTAPSGATATYTVNYTQYTVATSFGVSEISEYGPTANPLVNNIELPDGSEYKFTYEETPGSCTPLSGTYSTNCVTGRIASVALPTGGTITYTYSGGNNGIESDGSTAGLTRQLSPGGEWQYVRTQQSDSAAHWQTKITTPPDSQNSGSVGDDTVIDFQEDSSTVTPATHYFYETQRKAYQASASSGTLLATIITCYNAVYATNCATTHVSSPITQTDAYSQLPNGSNRLSQVVYNSYGLVTDDKEYNYGVATGSAPGTTDLVRETAISYASLTNGIVNKPSSVTVSDWTSGTAATLSSTTYTYDQGTPTVTSGTPQHVAVTGSRGNLTTLTTSTSKTASLTQTFTYYDTGTPNVATDVNPATTTTYAYSTAVQGSSTASCGNSFPTTVTVSGTSVNLSASTTWNCTGGVPTQTTDPNGKTLTSNYTDADFWRPANVLDQERNETTISYIGETAVEAALQNFNGGNSTSDSRTTVDGFGRPIFSQRLQGPGATNYDTSEVDYNNLGELSRATMPYSAAASPSTDNTTAPGITNTYDALGRVLTVTDADGGTIAYTYANNDVLQRVSGSQTFQKQFEYDGLGRLTSVCEISSTLTGFGTCAQTTSQKGFWTKYTYDALGHLLTVTQNAQAAGGSQQTRTFVYDMLGRMTSESNPETGNSGTNGTVTYTYDSISPCGDGTNYSFPGSLVQKKDNAGNFTCYSYDGLHRVLKAGNSSVTNTILREFVYDSETSYPTGVSVIYGKTHMVEAKTINTSNPTVNVTDEFYSYSSRGELTDVYESTPHSGGYYHTTASYWPTGALEALSGIPGVPTINYGAGGAGLDGEGRYTQVTAASGTNPVTNVTYSTSSTTNPLGALTGVTFGSTVSGNDNDSFTFDPNTGRAGSYTFSVNGKADAGTLTWNTNGTLGKLVIADALNTSDSQTCTYTHDDLARVSGASCSSSPAWSQTFAYDAFGNISKSGTSSFLPSYTFSNGAITNQFYSIPGISVAYDKNGNLLTDNLNTYTWDPNWGNPASVNSTVLIYDALGRMAEQQNGSTDTEILYSPVGRTALMSGQTLTKAFVNLPGGATAIYNSTGLAYNHHADWLGSSRLTSTASRTVYSDSAYAPFGEQYATLGTADASFTGQDQDTVGSLYDFPARRHSPSQGRWISPDPAGLAAVNLTNPQSLNRNTYVTNNPLLFTDPTGLEPRGVGGIMGGPVPFYWGKNGVDYAACTVDGLDTPCGWATEMMGAGAAVQCPNNYCGVISIDGVLVGFYAYATGSGYAPFAGPGSNFAANDQAMIAGALYAENQSLLNDGNEQCGVTSGAGDGYTYSVSVEGTAIDCDFTGAMTSDYQQVAGAYHSHGVPLPGYNSEAFSVPNPTGLGDVGVSNFWSLPVSLATPGGNVMIYYPNAGCQTFFLGSPYGTGTTIPICQ
jgi:RHS repeat-associated protein